MIVRKWGWVCMLLGLLVYSPWGYCQAPSQIELVESTWVDTLGKEHPLFGTSLNKAICLVFISTDCPISNSYQPELKRIHSEFSDRGIEFLFVHGVAETTLEAANRHRTEYRIDAPVILDPEHKLARWLHATTIPSVFVWKPESRQILYEGRISNLYEGFGKKRPSATRHELRDVLTAICEDNEIPIRSAPPIGCRIAWNKE